MMSKKCPPVVTRAMSDMSQKIHVVSSSASVAINLVAARPTMYHRQLHKQSYSTLRTMHNGSRVNSSTFGPTMTSVDGNISLVKFINYRYFSSDDTNTDIDKSKFTHESHITMPDMGNGDGKIVEWFKKEGDVVNRNDILCDIETPDFTFGMENEDERTAIMGKILVDAPSEAVKDDQVICVLLHEEKPKKN